MQRHLDLDWPERCEYVAHITKYVPPEVRLIPDILALVAEYGTSFILTWTYPTWVMHDFCPWRDIHQFIHLDFFAPWAKHISGLATVNVGYVLIDLLSDRTWHVRSPSAIALSRAHDPHDAATFKTKLPRDAYVIKDMALRGDSAIKNTMRECQDPIALAHHEVFPINGQVSFRSDIF